MWKTSLLLYLEPQLVRMDRAEKSVMCFSPQVEKLRQLAKLNKDLDAVWSELLVVPEETHKGGSSREISSNGIYSLGDPKTATAEKGRKIVQATVDRIVKFIESWNQATGKR